MSSVAVIIRLLCLSLEQGSTDIKVLCGLYNSMVSCQKGPTRHAYDEPVLFMMAQHGEDTSHFLHDMESCYLHNFFHKFHDTLNQFEYDCPHIMLWRVCIVSDFLFMFNI